MTTALCLMCGSLKFGALCPCGRCGMRMSDFDLSMTFCDHNFSVDRLKTFGKSIKMVSQFTPFKQHVPQVYMYNFQDELKDIITINRNMVWPKYAAHYHLINSKVESESEKIKSHKRYLLNIVVDDLRSSYTGLIFKRVSNIDFSSLKNRCHCILNRFKPYYLNDDGKQIILKDIFKTYVVAKSARNGYLVDHNWILKRLTLHRKQTKPWEIM